MYVIFYVLWFFSTRQKIFIPLDEKGVNFIEKTKALLFQLSTFAGTWTYVWISLLSFPSTHSHEKYNKWEIYRSIIGIVNVWKLLHSSWNKRLLNSFRFHQLILLAKTYNFVFMVYWICLAKDKNHNRKFITVD